MMYGRNQYNVVKQCILQLKINLKKKEKIFIKMKAEVPVNCVS